MKKRKTTIPKRPLKKGQKKRQGKQGEHLPEVFTRDKIASILNQRYTETDCSDFIWLKIAINRKPLASQSRYPSHEGSRNQSGERQIGKPSIDIGRKKELNLKYPPAEE